MFNGLKMKANNNDLFFDKIEQNKFNSIEQAEFEEIVRTINNVFNDRDDISEQFSKRKLLQGLDHLSRAVTHCKTDKRNRHYILNNLYKLKEGISSESQRRVFVE